MHDVLSSSSLTGATILLETEQSAVTYDYVCIIVLYHFQIIVGHAVCDIQSSYMIRKAHNHVTLTQTLQALIA